MFRYLRTNIDAIFPKTKNYIILFPKYRNNINIQSIVNINKLFFSFLGNSFFFQNNRNTFASVKATINFKKKDRKMGSVIIEYCDFVDNINGESYKVAGSGSSGFYFRQRIKP